MSLDVLAESRSFGGRQLTLRFPSRATQTPMRLAVYLPPQAKAGRPLPALIWLSGLTCTEENFTVKAGAQRIAAKLGLAVVAPDTSPRGADVPGDPDRAWDFGHGAGFYLDATEPPWATHYRMASHVADELPAVLAAQFPIDPGRLGVCGHSMGGHGALTLALNRPGLFRSVSAFAPICAPSQVPWGRKAFARYLGPDGAAWRAYDACALLEDGRRATDILVDQGAADPFLADQLRPDLLQAACAEAGQPLTLRRHAGYDHSYFFVASFIEDHLRWHAARLG